MVAQWVPLKQGGWPSRADAASWGTGPKCSEAPEWAYKTVLRAGLGGVKGHLVDFLSKLGNFSGPCSVLSAIGKVKNFEHTKLWIECCHGYCHPTD